jgi:hypothetical protein
MQASHSSPTFAPERSGCSRIVKHSRGTARADPNGRRDWLRRTRLVAHYPQRVSERTVQGLHCVHVKA